MPEPPKIERAQLQEVDQEFKEQINPEKALRVQFNPESLKVSLSNQLQQPPTGNQGGQSKQQFVGAGTMKLTCQLWFDVTVPPYAGETNDVRHVTEKVAYFITPKPQDGGNGGGGDSQQTQFLPPAVRFAWGTFQFDGMMDQFEENLELFSPDGRPLRASVSISLSQQKISAFEFGKAGAGSGPGRRPLSQVPQGGTIPALAAAVGRADWKSVAAANGIEDPLRPAPGSLIDLRGVR